MSKKTGVSFPDVVFPAAKVFIRKIIKLNAVGVSICKAIDIAGVVGIHLSLNHGNRTGFNSVPVNINWLAQSGERRQQ